MSTLAKHALGLALAALGSAAVASMSSQGPHARPRLISEFDALVPGQTATIAVTFEIDPHWHLYWPGRNDSGLPPTVTWTLPQGFGAGDASWPAPKRLVQPGDVLDHVYEDRLTMIVPVSVPKDAPPGSTVRLHADLSWLVCERVCLPESGSVDLDLPVRATASSAQPTKDRPLIDAARAVTPRPLPKSGGPVAVRVESGQVVFTAKGAERLAFFPFERCVPTPELVTQGESKGDSLTLRLEAGEGTNVAGVLEVRRKGEKSPTYYSIDAPVPAKESVTR